jgi:hypothetical protein
MNLKCLEDLCDELLRSDCERSAILAALTDAELKDAYLDVLRQFGLELVCGVDSHSHWMSDFLLIVANQGPIHACETALYAVLVELDRRGVDEPDVAEEERLGGEE